MRELGLADLLAETETVSDGFVLDPAEAQEVVRLLNKTEGVDLISAPRVSTLSGRQARISDLGPRRGVLGGLIGVSVDLIPRISRDGRTVDLLVIAELGERNSQPSAVDSLVLP